MQRGWAGRRGYTLGVALVASLAYGVTAAVLLFSSAGGSEEGELAPVHLEVMLGAVLALMIGAAVLGKVFRATSAFNGAMISLLVSALSIGAIAFGSSDAILGEVIPAGPMRVFARVAASIVATAFGAVVAAVWIPDAASSPTSTEGD